MAGLCFVAGVGAKGDLLQVTEMGVLKQNGLLLVLQVNLLHCINAPRRPFCPTVQTFLKSLWKLKTGRKECIKTLLHVMIEDPRGTLN